MSIHKFKPKKIKHNTDEIEQAYKIVLDSRKKVKLASQDIIKLLELIDYITISDLRDNKVIISKSKVYANANMKKNLENRIEDYKEETIPLSLISDKGYRVTFHIKYPELSKKENTLYMEKDAKDTELSDKELDRIQQMLKWIEWSD